MDCLEYLAKLPDKSVDLVLIDPPYLYKDYSKGNDGFDEKEENINFVKSISSGFETDLTFKQCERVLKKMNIFCFCSKDQLPIIMNWGINAKYQVNVLVWKKGGRPFGITYLHDIEFIVHIRQSGAVFNGMYKSRVIEQISKRDTGHPTQKPLALIQRLVEYGSNKNDIVLDCFMGSGSTAIACVNTQRQFLGCELDPKYVEIANKRISERNSGLL